MMNFFKRNNRRCGDFPWQNKWHIKMNKKPHRYYCFNCGHTFYTGKFTRFDSKMYDDVCPYCGAIGDTLEEVIKELEERKCL